MTTHNYESIDSESSVFSPDQNIVKYDFTFNIATSPLVINNMLFFNNFTIFFKELSQEIYLYLSKLEFME